MLFFKWEQIRSIATDILIFLKSNGRQRWAQTYSPLVKSTTAYGYTAHSDRMGSDVASTNAPINLSGIPQAVVKLYQAFDAEFDDVWSHKSR